MSTTIDKPLCSTVNYNETEAAGGCCFEAANYRLQGNHSWLVASICAVSDRFKCIWHCESVAKECAAEKLLCVGNYVS